MRVNYVLASRRFRSFVLPSGPCGNSKVGRPAAYYRSRAGYTTTIYTRRMIIIIFLRHHRVRGPPPESFKTKWMNPVWPSPSETHRRGIWYNTLYYTVIKGYVLRTTTIAFYAEIICHPPGPLSNHIFLLCPSSKRISVVVVINGQTTVSPVCVPITSFKYIILLYVGSYGGHRHNVFKDLQ